MDYSHSLCFLSILLFLLLSLFLFGYKCDAVLLSSVFLLIWLWLIPLMVFILNSPDAPLARTPGSEYERGSHLMLCSLCFALFRARYIPFFFFHTYLLLAPQSISLFMAHNSGFIPNDLAVYILIWARGEMAMFFGSPS